MIRVMTGQNDKVEEMCNAFFAEGNKHDVSPDIYLCAMTVIASTLYHEFCMDTTSLEDFGSQIMTALKMVSASAQRGTIQ